MTDNFGNIYAALQTASLKIYQALKKGHGLSLAGDVNATGDDQIGLDVFADEAFIAALSNSKGVRSIMSEEQPDLIPVDKGAYTIALDPLDGSKSALYGVPCGAIFGIFKDVSAPEDLKGANIVASGFFVFGINLEMYFADESGAFTSTYDEDQQNWSSAKRLPALPNANVFAVNVSGVNYWHNGLRLHYFRLHKGKSASDTETKASPPKGRWFASLVLDAKRLILQGGVFAYPANSMKNYENGHLRLVYEGIPMGFLVEKLGGASSNGEGSLLVQTPSHLHQKTPVFLGEPEKIAAIERAMQS